MISGVTTIHRRPSDGVSYSIVLLSFLSFKNDDGTIDVSFRGEAYKFTGSSQSLINLYDDDGYRVDCALTGHSYSAVSVSTDGGFSDGGSYQSVSSTGITFRLISTSDESVIATLQQPLSSADSVYQIVWERSVVTVEYDTSMQGQDNMSGFDDDARYIDREQVITNTARLMHNGSVVAMSNPSVSLSAPWSIDTASYSKSQSVASDGSLSLTLTLKASEGHAFRIDSDVSVSLSCNAPDGTYASYSFALSPASKGSEGDPGGAGTGISITSVTVKYGESSSCNTKPSEWSLSIPYVTNGSYMWTWTHTEYSDGTKTDAYSVSRMGIDGGGVKSSDVDYYMSQSSVDVSTITGWGDFPSTLIDGYWLYIRTTIIYSDNSTTVSYDVRRLGNGSFYAGLQEYYNIGESYTEPPSGYPIKSGQNYPLRYGNGESPAISGGWSETRKYGTASKPYIWNFEISYDSDGTKYVTQPICIGNYTKSIDHIEETYAISASSTMRSDGGVYYPPDDITEWTDEQIDAAPTETKRYQWNRTRVFYFSQVNPDVFYHVSAVRGSDGETPTIGDDGYWYIGGNKTGTRALGLQGCVTVFMGEWQQGVCYVNERDNADKISANDVRYIHIVQRRNGSAIDCYVRTTTMVSGSQRYAEAQYDGSYLYKEPSSDNSAFWEKTSMEGLLATDVLMSNDAWIEHLTGKAVYCTVNKSDSGATLASPIVQTGMQSVTDNSVPTIFAGADQSNTTTAPFRVYKNGKLVAQNAEIVGKVTSTDADISGKVTATRGNIGGFEIGANALVNSSNNASIEITDASQVTKIGASAVDAITSKKCSMSAVSKSTGTHNTALYLDAHGATYNYAFHGNGNGVLNGLVYGYKVSIMKLKTSADDMLYTTLGNGSTVVLSGVNGNTVTGGTHCIALPKLSEVRQSLGISVSDTSTSFAIEITYINRCGYDGCWLCFKTDTHFGDNDALPYRMSGDNTNYTGTASRIHLQKGDISRLMLVYNHDTLDYCAYEISHLS